MNKLKLLLILVVCLTLTTQAQNAYKVENGALVLPSEIRFEAGSDKLKPESEEALDFVVAYLNEKTYITLMRVESHVAQEGNEKDNIDLTMRRSMAVCTYLVGKGIDCKRLIAVGFGSSKPAASNDTPDGKAQNRRCMFVNAALRGRAIGGMPVDGGGNVAGDSCK